MSNTSPRSAIPSRICPSCGTRIADSASRCAVCGMVFETGTGRSAKIPSRISGTSASMNLPIGVVIAGPIFALLFGALVVVLVVRTGHFPGTASTPATLPALTPTITLTLLPTETPTITPTVTPLPPIVVTVAAGDTCYGLIAPYGYQDPNIMTDKNGHAVDCTNLQPGETIYIPQPTSTPLLRQPLPREFFNKRWRLALLTAIPIKDGDSLAELQPTTMSRSISIKKYNPQYSFANDVVYVGH